MAFQGSISIAIMEVRIVCLRVTLASTVGYPLHHLPNTYADTLVELDLPEYETYEDLRKQLHTAITAGSSYFGFA